MGHDIGLVDIPRRLDAICSLERHLQNSIRVFDCDSDVVTVDGHDEESSSIHGKFTWEEMKKSTMNFSHVIGYGGFSTVYLAESSSTKWAVKVQATNTERLNRVFSQELEVLRCISHPNIVKLLGNFVEEKEDVGVLVFEYVPNGTLQEKLGLLSWKRRALIAFQLAEVLEFLHENSGSQIVHGDIKASNILLDEHLDCKLCDFGSAKMGFSSMVMPPSSSRMNRRIVGSQGYMDPYYMKTGIVSKKTDIYSFGVILLELITGREAFSVGMGESLTSFASPLLKDETRVGEMMDRRLEGKFDLQEAKALASIASTCISPSPFLRPSTSQILASMRENIPSLSCTKL